MKGFRRVAKWIKPVAFPKPYLLEIVIKENTALKIVTKRNPRGKHNK